jgi:hypothetical protein
MSASPSPFFGWLYQFDSDAGILLFARTQTVVRFFRAARTKA